jgi:hypothetical protein
MHEHCHGVACSLPARSGCFPAPTTRRSAAPLAAAAASTAESASEVQPILVGVNCERVAAAAALVGHLQDRGCTEVWATGEGLLGGGTPGVV